MIRENTVNIENTIYISISIYPTDMMFMLFPVVKIGVLQVRVVEVPGVSMELCGGTHVSNTSEIRGFKIISEQGIASGVRRIEAVAGEAFIEYVNARDSYLKQLCSTLKVCSRS